MHALQVMLVIVAKWIGLRDRSILATISDITSRGLGSINEVLERVHSL